MAEDLSGFSIAPNPNCPHITDSTFEVHSDLQPSKTGAAGKAPKRNLFEEYQACTACGDTDETWVCVVCTFSGCSRFRLGHMVDHANDVRNSGSHVCVAISLFDLSCWCFGCEEYVVHPKLHKVFCEMHQGKFGFTPRMSLHTEAAVTLTIKDTDEVKDSGS